MYYGIVETESLANPTVLKQLNVHKTVVIEPPESTSAKEWNINILHIDDQSVDRTKESISTNIKDEWFAVLFNDKKFYVIFRHKIFELERQRKNKAYRQMVDYGESHGIQKIYLDFDANFKNYKELIN